MKGEGLERHERERMTTTTAIPLPLLQQARVASPCPMKWSDMTPTDQDAVRHCGACDLNVYNFAELTAPEAERLLQEHLSTGQRLCGTIWRRADGTIITKNCPVGWRAARQRALRAGSRIAAAIGLLLTGGIVVGAPRSHRWAKVRAVEPFRSISEWISPTPLPPVGGLMMSGDICVTPPMPAPSPAPVPSPVAPEPAQETH